MDTNIKHFPPQALPLRSKGEKWRKAHLDWAETKSMTNYSPVRKSLQNKKINYDLVNGILHMDDMKLLLNPLNVKTETIPKEIQHFSIMKTQLDVLIGEEMDKTFDYRVIVTNPTAISEIEKNKKKAVLQQMEQLLQTNAESEEEYNKGMEEMQDYFTYEWQDMREIRANAILNHYSKEYNIPLKLHEGFKDGLIVGEEIYMCDIVGGEPVVERLNPMKVRVFRNGYSNKIEDADCIIIEDYWSINKVIDKWHEVLTEKEIKSFDKALKLDGEDTYFTDDTLTFQQLSREGIGVRPDSAYVTGELSGNGDAPFDEEGNIKVTRMFWKSRRKIQKIKYYDPETGEPLYRFESEFYVPNETKGEESQTLYINQAWEGTKIGKDIYVDMGPRAIQYNTISNPSRCHFGIVGSVYNTNEARPYSLVDQLKPFNYLYDIIHHRLNNLISKDWGVMVRLDDARRPKNMSREQWYIFCKNSGIYVEDSFNEGSYGASLGKMAGALNNASTGVINASNSVVIQQYWQLLQWIRMEMTQVSGITDQRLGAISNRETVGGVERSVLQSSHVTRWYSAIHDDVKKRVLECFLETAKIALKGKSKKFQYILSDNSMRIMDIDGDDFAESDYGLVVDASNSTNEMRQKLDTICQAAMQNQAADLSVLLQCFNNATSLAEKVRLLQNNERRIKEQQAQAQDQQNQIQQQQIQAQMQQAQMQMQQEDMLNQRDNETKILVAHINAQAKDKIDVDGPEEYSQEAKGKLMESIRQFDQKIALEHEKLNLDKQRLSFDKDKARTDASIKREALKRKPTSTAKK